MVFRRGKRYWFRLYNSAGENESRTTGASDRSIAHEIADMCRALRAQRKWAVLDALWDRTLGLAVAREHWIDGTLDTLTAQLADRDLAPLVPEWAASLRARFPKAHGSGATPVRYPAHVGAFVKAQGAAGHLYASRFTPEAVDRFTAGLGLAPATVQRYLAALSSFAGYCVQRGALAENPVARATWPRGRDLTKRTRHLTYAEQTKLVEAAEGSLQTVLVLAHLGLEWGAIYALTRADVDLPRKRLRARGTKTATRDRWVHIEGWALPYLERACAVTTPHGRVAAAFGHLGDAEGRQMWARLRKLTEALGVEDYHLHDARHTYAVRHVAAGVPAHAVGRALGHADGSQVLARYGIYAPTDDDLERYARQAEARDHETPNKRGAK